MVVERLRISILVDLGIRIGHIFNITNPVSRTKINEIPFVYHSVCRDFPDMSTRYLRRIIRTKLAIEESGVIGGDGYEWITFPPNSQTNFYRAPGDKEWILWEK